MRELLSYKTAASIKEMYGCNTQYNLQKNAALLRLAVLIGFQSRIFPQVVNIKKQFFKKKYGANSLFKRNRKYNLQANVQV